MARGRKPIGKLQYIDGKEAKMCGNCNIVKILDEFYNHNNSPINSGFMGKHSTCIACFKIRNRNNHLKRMALSLGESANMYLTLYNEQGGKCLICKINFDKLYIDHNHETNRIRGLLCANCNSGLGMFQDNKGYLMNAIIYLSRE